MLTIDLNADLGEGYDSDESLLDIVTSANVACGAHAGDRATMEATVRAALARGVAIGAHPSYPGRANFGRAAMARSAGEIFDDVTEQLRALAEVVAACGARLAHVKPHGALYTTSASDPGVAEAIACAVRAFDPRLALVGLAGSASTRVARARGLRAVDEGFADRRYMPTGALVSRALSGALVEDVDEAARQAVALARDGRAQTICLHGDAPHALATAQRVRAALRDAGIVVRALA